MIREYKGFKFEREKDEDNKSIYIYYLYDKDNDIINVYTSLKVLKKDVNNIWSK